LISKIGDTYIVYNQYQIIPDDNKFNIYEKNGKLKHLVTTYTSASAISWCIADKKEEIELANNIIACDNKIEFLLGDITHTKQVLKNTPSSHREGVLLARLQEYNLKHYKLKGKLHKYIQRAKYIKKLGLDNESKRTSRKKHVIEVR